MKWMNSRSCCALIVAIGAGGCGSPEGLFPVSGKVLYRGQPAAGAVVYFHCVSEPKGAPVPHGVVNDDGSYSLEIDGMGKGARPGAYAVLVGWGDTKANGVSAVKTRGSIKLVQRSRLRSSADRLSGRYLNAAKPLLHAKVAETSNDLPPFELTD